MSCVQVGFVQARMGLSPGFGGATWLVRLVGRARAVELLATGAILGAKELKEVTFFFSF